MAPIGARLAARNPDRDLVRRTLAPYLEREQPVVGAEYWSVTNGFHGQVEELGGNRVVELMARIIGHIWHEHIVTRMDTTDLRLAIHEEHRAIARAIIGGHETRAANLMHDHFEQLLAEYTRHWPGRFDELIEWE
jgi:DNA-binding GntR family transcriptional regulator